MWKKSEIEIPNSEINNYFCGVNQGLNNTVFPSYFHGAAHRISRFFNPFIYLKNDLFHQITGRIITG
ncbi:hypothetical protein CLV57_3023 [Mucilaginibacter auburnensis]|uniref:Uncharacterized protein n=1 Tax=Mucilaginibacter auburnensis TaxID=1457233 RepID=A0A2H9VNI6_9SPHI|nr:hypothetical protein CLV57_3023 [Mucilaginibacter auburnensis]